LSFRTRTSPTAPPAALFDPPAWWKVALVLFAVVIAQSTIAPHVALRGAVPGLVLLLVLWYGFRTDVVGGLLLGAIAGACEDALAGPSGAGWTVSTAIVGALAGRSAGTFISESRTWLVPYVALATIVRYGVYAIVTRAEGQPIVLPTMHAHEMLWQALYNAVLAFALLTFVPKTGVSRVGLR
jgi:rod shape-determining protein MreD